MSVQLSNEESNQSENLEPLCKALEPIQPNSEYKFVWDLPANGATRYVMTLQYKLKTDSLLDNQISLDEVFTYIDPVAFDTTKV